MNKEQAEIQSKLIREVVPSSWQVEVRVINEGYSWITYKVVAAAQRTVRSI